jgi:hypothetical protein
MLTNFFASPELSELVSDELFEGDHPQRLVDADADALSGPFDDLDRMF